jgi:hypothetical protein
MRLENSHQSTRERERRMRGFRVPERTQAFFVELRTDPAALRDQATSTVRFALPQATRRTLCFLASLHWTHPRSVGFLMKFAPLRYCVAQTPQRDSARLQTALD